MAREPLIREVSESVRAAPAAPLRGLVSWYSGYRQAGVPPARHRGLHETDYGSRDFAVRDPEGPLVLRHLPRRAPQAGLIPVPRPASAARCA